MPTKGPRRAHEAFTNQTSTGYSPEVTLDTSQTQSTAGQLGGGWVSDAGINIGLPNHDVAPDWLRERANASVDEHEPTDTAGESAERSSDGDGPGGLDGGEGEASGSERAPERTYRGEDVEVRIHNVTGLRESADASQLIVPTPIQAIIDGHQVDGELTVQRHGRRLWDVQPGELNCDCGQDPCEHRQGAVEAVRALINARRIRSAVGSWERTRARASQRLQAAAAAEATSRAGPTRPEPDAPDWSNDDNTDIFQDAYEAASARQAAGESPVPYVGENATAGLGDRNGGRGFGVEIEFDLTGVANQAAAIRSIGRDLHEAGLTPSSHQTGYHSGARGGYQSWSFERDSTVAGEIVSPVLYDEPQSWNELAQVCEIVKRHGGTATARTGGHVHVSCGDYDHTVENHNRLLAMANEYEDTLYRLSHNPQRPAHRGLSWCRPNRSPSSGYANIGDVQRREGNHGVAVNFGSVGGSATDHVEFRMWDASLDPGVIQAQINLSLGMTDAAFRRSTPTGAAEPVGTHRQSNAHLQRGERLGGQAWKDNTRSFRRLMDTVFWRETNKRQAAALFGVTRWQRSR